MRHCLEKIFPVLKGEIYRQDVRAITIGDAAKFLHELNLSFLFLFLFFTLFPRLNRKWIRRKTGKTG